MKRINWGASGKRIARRRALCGLSQSDLAEYMRTDVASVSKWENNRRPVGLQRAFDIAFALGVKVEDLFK